MDFEHEEIFWSRLGWNYDPPRRDASGALIRVGPEEENLIRYHRDFYKAGIKLHSSILFSGWDAAKHFDDTLTDHTLETMMNLAPDLYYLPRIKLNVPIDWCKENPEEVFIYENGPRSVEEIRRLVGTSRHDILGTESASGLGNSGKWHDDRPNIDGKIGLQSFSSEKWLSDAGDALRHVIRRVESSPYAKRIPGYHVAFGMCGETMLWGAWEYGPKRKIGDYGIGNSKAFYRYGLQKYGSLENLKKAWHRDSLSEYDCVPSHAEREDHTDSLERLFMMGENDKICIDYQLFHSSVTVSALETFGKIVKEETNGKLAGCFYGYYLGSPGSAYTGHLGLKQLLNSPYFDFISSPKGYHRCGPGEAGGEHLPALSVNRKKLYLDEIDCRTHLSMNPEGSSLNESKTLLIREFAKNMQNHSGFWWMDLEGGNFDSPELMNLISSLKQNGDLIRSMNSGKIAQVLIVSDEESILYQRFNVSLHTQILKETVSELKLCGTLVDHVRLSDLSDLDLSSYRLIVFLNCYRISDPGMLERIPKQTVLLWHCACGIRQESISLENLRGLTGMGVKIKSFATGETWLKGENLLSGLEIRRHPQLPLNYPVFEIEHPDAVCLGRYDSGEIGIASLKYHGRTVFYTGVPWLKNHSLRRIMEYSGVHFYAPLNVILYGDTRFIGVFSRVSVDFDLNLPQKGIYRELTTGQSTGDVSSVHLTMKANESRLFILIQKIQEK